MIRILDKNFEISITKEKIQESVKALAEKLNKDYNGKCPIVVCILNGAFVFAADLVRELTFQPEIQFAKFSSYDGMQSTGEVTEILGVNENVKGRDVIIVEDIVDTGITLKSILPKFHERGAASVKIACLLQKPEKLQVDLTVDYCSMQIPNDFIVGYGLDYDGYGRNYPDIYVFRP